jgi:hypothetical protein
MTFKTIVLWSLIHNDPDRLESGDRTVASMMPLVEALFPGINYYSITGFSEVLRECVVPALKNLCPELLSISGEEVADDATTEIRELLPSDGYEWQHNIEWRTRFEELLAAA